MVSQDIGVPITQRGKQPGRALDVGKHQGHLTRRQDHPAISLVRSASGKGHDSMILSLFETSVVRFGTASTRALLLGHLALLIREDYESILILSCVMTGRDI